MPFKRQYYDPFLEQPHASPQATQGTIVGLAVDKPGTYLLVSDVAVWLRQQAQEMQAEGRSGPWHEALEAVAETLEQI